MERAWTAPPGAIYKSKFDLDLIDAGGSLKDGFLASSTLPAPLLPCGSVPASLNGGSYTSSWDLPSGKAPLMVWEQPEGTCTRETSLKNSFIFNHQMCW